MSVQSDLRAAVFERDKGMCRWPKCVERADESAHLTSRGMGGSKHRDTLDNACALCWNHARMSDGEHGDGGASQYLRAHLDLLGAAFLEMEASYIAYERAEALREIIR